MNYYEAKDYLKEISSLGSILGLDTIKELLKRVGNPQKNLKVVHIAGTNGKGSIMAFLESILILSGYKVARFSSPAVFETREIIRINKKNIRKEEYSSLVSKIKKVCETMVKDGFSHPTKFEIETVMALLYFEESDCDICLIECGMGGEGDATNVFDKVLLSILSSISLDHMEQLGDTVETITKVKAGIIKKNCPVVVSSQKKDSIRDVIDKIARKKGSEVVYAGKALMKKQNMMYQSSSGKHYEFQMCMQGTCQFYNVATAIEAAEVLEKYGFKLSEFICDGIKATYWEGRMEVISTNPIIIIDGAHNPDAVYELQKTIDLYFTNQRIAFIMGVLADKNFEQEAKLIAQGAECIYTITPNNERALSGETLRESLLKYHQNVIYCESIYEAYKKTKEDIARDRVDMILAFGSLSYLGELKKIVEDNM